MRMIVNVVLPYEPFNTKVRNGTVGEPIGAMTPEDLQRARLPELGTKWW